jgi:hypothetical protein
MKENQNGTSPRIVTVQQTRIFWCGKKEELDDEGSTATRATELEKVEAERASEHDKTNDDDDELIGNRRSASLALATLPAN